MIERSDPDDMGSLYYFVATQAPGVSFSDLTFPQIRCLMDQHKQAMKG